MRRQLTFGSLVKSRWGGRRPIRVQSRGLTFFVALEFWLKVEAEMLNGYAFTVSGQSS